MPRRTSANNLRPLTPDYYPVYAAMMLASEDYASLDATETGILTLLSMHQWVNGDLPDDARKLSRMARCTVEQIEAFRAAFPKLCAVSEIEEGGATDRLAIPFLRRLWVKVVGQLAAAREHGARGGAKAAERNRDRVGGTNGTGEGTPPPTGSCADGVEGSLHQTNATQRNAYQRNADDGAAVAAPQSRNGKTPKAARAQGRFTPPTVEQVAAYCRERRNAVDAQAFIDHYASAGWMRGRTKIADWRACVRTWESQRKAETTSGYAGDQPEDLTGISQRGPA